MTKLELANGQIVKVIGYLKQHEKYMDYMDLKLHYLWNVDMEKDFNNDCKVYNREVGRSNKY